MYVYDENQLYKYRTINQYSVKFQQTSRLLSSKIVTNIHNKGHQSMFNVYESVKVDCTGSIVHVHFVPHIRGDD